MLDVAQAADYFGVPRQIISLCISFYLAPMHIRVGRAWAKPLFPQKSIVADCTWATVLIRCLMLGPAERCVAELSLEASSRCFTLSLKIYVGDLTLLMSAALEQLRNFAVRAANRLIGWIIGTLQLTVAAISFFVLHLPQT